MYLWIEGLDGSGKSTLAKRLGDALAPALLARFPSEGTTAGRLVRRIFAGEEQCYVPETMLYLMAADALEYEFATTRPSLQAGVPMICDRHTLVSAWVYQTEDGWTIPEIYAVLQPEIYRKPDLTIILDVPASIALRRIELRSVASGNVVTLNSRYENNLDVKREKYLAFAQMQPFGPCVVVDGRGSYDDVYEQVLGHLKRRNLWPT